MKKSAIKVIVITPFTKRFGIAVFSNSELLYFAVKTYKNPRTIESIKAEATQKLKNLIDEFKPELIIAKSLTRRQAVTNDHTLLVETIRCVAKLVSVPVDEVSFEEARRKLVFNNRPTKSRTFAVLQNIYPELTRFIHFQNRSQREYYTPLLSAVAIGLAQARTDLKPTETF